MTPVRQKKIRALRNSSIHKIRALLRDSLDGVDVCTIVRSVKIEPENVRRILHNMPDAYIDRWTRQVGAGRPYAIWCVVIPPENCPPPTIKRKPKDQK